ncbi:MAG: guanylate kinase [Bacteroidales bacterium]|nr:guanylate kinase [Bacteroidales bacterium]MBD5228501.1 guanylate kinase [Bacteroidales bacterium]MBD5235374.1 guanylate kinase [Barnesiella sp.]MBD5257885.1 guanylate kinase [Barnesiella sp.]
MSGKLIIISAPSGCGKSTIIHDLTQRGNIDMTFSVSATNRKPRQGEIDGVHYHFLSTAEFNDRIAAGDFLEYEEVYPGRFYGTLKSEINRALDAGKNIVLDIDVKGGVNVKEIYGNRAISIFIEPPSVDELRRRLENRGTESREVIDERIARAEFELSLAPKFDTVVVNDNLTEAIDNAEQIILNFINGAAE